MNEIKAVRLENVRLREGVRARALKIESERARMTKARTRTRPRGARSRRGSAQEMSRRPASSPGERPNGRDGMGFTDDGGAFGVGNTASALPGDSPRDARGGPNTREPGAASQSSRITR